MQSYVLGFLTAVLIGYFLLYNHFIQIGKRFAAGFAQRNFICIFLLVSRAVFRVSAF